MIKPLHLIHEDEISDFGGKAVNLSRLISLGYRVPRGLALSTSFYLDFIRDTSLEHSLNLELKRRDMENMRWEELWDTALRIRSLFLGTPIPDKLTTAILPALSEVGYPLVVRSSAPEEDSGNSSFAGLHESVVDISTPQKAVDAVRIVWASLWSDSSLLYRKELGLQAETSSMGVVIQEMIRGEVSGVAFTRNPADDSDHFVIEAVEGLNEKLVSGDSDPFRLIIEKNRHKTLSVSEGEYSRPLLSREEVKTLVEALTDLETSLAYPLDVEWTFRGGELYLLQVRPITTTRDPRDKLWEREDKRPWYRSLTPSFESLSRLRDHIEGSVLPGMKAETERLEEISLDRMDSLSLADEIIRRKKIHSHWKDTYWQDLIPFAHGVRLFGRLYNDVIKPENPYEFTRLLSSQGMISLSRNQELVSLALRISSSPHIKKSLEEGRIEEIDPSFRRDMDAFMENYSRSVYRGTRLFSDTDDLTSLLLNLARGVNTPSAAPAAELEEVFLSSFPSSEREGILDILSIARASWRLRDDDNHYLAAIEAALLTSLSLGRKRLDTDVLDGEGSPDEIAALLRGDPLPSMGAAAPPASPSQEGIGEPVPGKRRFTGQPASMGVGRGRARVITSPEDLFSFTKGEVLVCDAIDPNMTFVVPLASAIIERRGGMLIHGAIIAREYGIPCVTGVEEAVAYISTGDLLVVDGFLGTVSLSEE